jgi:hypothetical protein
MATTAVDDLAPTAPLAAPAPTAHPSPLALLTRAPAPLLTLALTVVHAAFVLLATAQGSLAGTYRSLLEWDAQWYASVVDDGYQCDLEALARGPHNSNCGYFPGLPVLASGVKRLLGVPTWLALPLVAQACCWGFWTYLLLLLRRWGVSPAAQAITVLFLVLYPWSFFLQVGYSESPFLLFLLGYVYWGERPGRWGTLLAAAHGAGMTGTRLMGAAAVGWPLLRRSGARRWHRRLVLAAASLLGLVLFYGYLGWRFGHPDLYHRVQASGWGVRPDYLVVLRWDAYVPKYTNGIVCPVLIAWLVWLAWRQWRRPAVQGADGNLPWALLSVAGVLFYLAEAAMINRQLCSLPRIAYPSVVLLTLATAHQATYLPARPIPARWRAALITFAFVAGLACLVFQAHLVQRFIHRRWVA